MDVLEPSNSDLPDGKSNHASGNVDLGLRDREGSSRNGRTSGGEPTTTRDEEIISILTQKEKKTGLEEWQDGSGKVDWLHGKNPLNVAETNTEWLLLTLVEKLEIELLELRRRLGNTVDNEE
jgi:hypothetical protein